MPAYIGANTAAYYNTCVAGGGAGAAATSRLTPSGSPVARSRVFAALVAGVVAGVLGLTNVLGFLAYLVAMCLVRAAARRAPSLGLRSRCAFAAAR